MNNRCPIPFRLLTGVIVLLTFSDRVAALTTAFTYQGRLTDGPTVASGTYDFKFQLYNMEAGGTAISPAVAKDDLVVTNGLFSLELDFGSNVFNGDDHWLEISVRAGLEAGAYILLAPRQAVTPAPYATYSAFAGNAISANAVAWSSLTRMPAGFADGVDNDTLYSAGAALELTGSTFSVRPGGIVNSMLASDAITIDKVASGQLVRSVNTLQDDIQLEGTNNVVVANTGRLIQIAAFDLWKLNGNSGTGEANFLGTLDPQPLELRVNNSRALRLEPNATSPNLIGGSSGNFAAPGVYGAVIGGGGESDALNRITDHYGTVSGGLGNQAGNDDGNSFVGRYATVSGGYFNRASGDASSVGGGSRCAADGELATVAGGSYNVASGYAAVVSGGGGYSASLDRSLPNRALGYWTTIGGGADNSVTNEFGVVAGGGHNRAGGIYASIGGGKDNSTTGPFASIPGGRQNSAQGSTSFAGGYRAVAEHDGAFVWADGTAGSDFRSETPDEFAVRATGGVRFVSATDTIGNPISGVRLPAGGGGWATLSDRNSKDNFAEVNERAILNRLASVPIQSWNYKAQDPSIRHIGVMAQDFAAAFQFGEDDTHVNTVDADGIALAAIKGLYQLVQEKDSEMNKKDAEIEALKERLVALEKAVFFRNKNEEVRKHEID